MNRRLRPEILRRRRRRLLALVGVCFGGLLVFVTLRIAYEGELFRVREITFRGLVNANPAVLVAEAGLTRRHSIFDDFSLVVPRLLRDPLVRAAALRRELPGRLIVEVEERRPAAYWADSTLVPVDAGGHVLPLRVAHYGWDLPILMARGEPPRPPAVQAGRLVDADARALLRLVIGIRDRVPEVARRISVAELGPEGRVAFRMMGIAGEEAEVRLRLETPLDKVALVPGVIRDLEHKGTALRRVDLSYEDQIVVVPADTTGSREGSPAPPADAPAAASDAWPYRPGPDEERARPTEAT